MVPMVVYHGTRVNVSLYRRVIPVRTPYCNTCVRSRLHMRVRADSLGAIEGDNSIIGGELDAQVAQQRRVDALGHEVTDLVVCKQHVLLRADNPCCRS